MDLFVDVRFDSENSDHLLWRERLLSLLAAAPDGVNVRTSDGVHERTVSVQELGDYLRQLGYPAGSFRGDARRMWNTLLTATGVDVATVRSEGHAMTVSLTVLKGLTLGNFAPESGFEGHPVKMETRLRLLAFVASLR